jgi:peroxiredoxin
MRNPIRSRPCAVLAALLLPVVTAVAAPRVGAPAPDFSGTDTAGERHSLADYRGRTLVLEWTNHDCPYVRKHYGAGNMQAQQKAARDAGAVWLSIISSAPGKQGHVSPAEADQITEARGAAPTAVILDPTGEIGRAYAARTTPHMYVIDAEGVLRYMGGIDDIPTSDPEDIPRAEQYVRAALADIQAGRPVAEPVTRPYGCSVKY